LEIKLLRSQKGQAALSDSLYFLLIVSGLATLLFFFAAGYGSTVEQKVVRQYWSEYNTGALETILYSSTPRIAGQTLENSSEVDYLLAAVKEDFADDSEIDETSAVLAQNISGIMQPIAGNFDYLFYLYRPDVQEFAFVMIYARDPPTITETGNSSEVEPGNVKTYFCKPASLNELEALIEHLGSSSQSNARIQLIELDEEGNAGYFVAQANLTMWIPTPVDLSSFNCEVHSCITPEGKPCP